MDFGSVLQEGALWNDLWAYAKVGLEFADSIVNENAAISSNNIFDNTYICRIGILNQIRR